MWDVLHDWLKLRRLTTGGRNLPWQRKVLLFLQISKKWEWSFISSSFYIPETVPPSGHLERQVRCNLHMEDDTKRKKISTNHWRIVFLSWFEFILFLFFLCVFHSVIYCKDIHIFSRVHLLGYFPKNRHLQSQTNSNSVKLTSKANYFSCDHIDKHR